MDNDYTNQGSPAEGSPACCWRLPDPADDTWRAYDSGARYGSARREAGVRTTRRASNWTAAALIAGVAATSGYFVHAAATTPSGSAGGTTQLIQQPGVATAHGQHPNLSHAVVTSGGSGVVAGSGAGGAAGGTGGSGATGWVDN